MTLGFLRLPRSLALSIAGSIAFASSQNGYMALCTTHEVIRADEARQPISFESPEVAASFHKVAKLNEAKQAGGVYVGSTVVPLVARKQWLAENAKFNDAATRCDNDRDGVITKAEVDGFGKPD